MTGLHDMAEDDRLPHDDGAPDRRALLRLGAIGAVGVVTIRPGIAQAASSVLTCQIPVPDPTRRGQYIASDGSVVPPGTAGAFAPPPTPLRGEDVKNAIAGRSYPGQSPEASQAYTNYIRRLQRGQAGFTCFASLQMPR
jgi:hypothetical protein